jgi:hypothetical protein
MKIQFRSLLKTNGMDNPTFIKNEVGDVIDIK